MQLTTLCYMKQDDKYLMLHRIKKQKDPNEGKWIGIGGKFEADESPEECLLREVKEETGLELTNFQFHGVVTFVAPPWETEQMFLYTADAFTGTLLTECREGVLEWVPIEDVLQLNLWEGDKIFLKLLLEEQSFFNLKLVYQNDKLVCAALNGRAMELTTQAKEK